MLADLRGSVPVEVMALTCLDQGHQNLLKFGEVGGGRRSARILRIHIGGVEDTVEFVSQVERLRLSAMRKLQVLNNEVVQACPVHVFARVHFADIFVEKRRQLLLRLSPGVHVFHISASLLQELLARVLVLHDRLEVGIAAHVRLAVRVRVTADAKFKAQPVEERFLFRRWYDVRHDVPHLKLDTDGVQRHDKIRVVEGPMAPESLCFSRDRVQGVSSFRGLCPKRGTLVGNIK